LVLKLASISGFCVAVLTFMLLIMRDSILAIGFVAIIIQVLSVLLMLWARFTFGLRSFHATANPTEGGLITSGPYHYFRHPIYAAVIYFLWAGIFSHVSLLNVLLGVIATIGMFIRIYAEERFLTKRYPNYAEYAVRTKRIVPYIF
jgi:protein-S-isoprenylcysteine O-methyltransferase Ste14